MKGIVAIFTITASLAIVGCSFFGPAEEVQHQSARTVYRASAETPFEVPDVTPVRQKVPGETR